MSFFQSEKPKIFQTCTNCVNKMSYNVLWPNSINILWPSCMVDYLIDGFCYMHAFSHNSPQGCRKAQNIDGPIILVCVHFNGPFYFEVAQLFCRFWFDFLDNFGFFVRVLEEFLGLFWLIKLKEWSSFDLALKLPRKLVRATDKSRFQIIDWLFGNI